MHRLGVIGKPSDWLISSDVNYQSAKDLFEIELININISELIELSNNRKEEADIVNEEDWKLFRENGLWLIKNLITDVHLRSTHI